MIRLIAARRLTRFGSTATPVITNTANLDKDEDIYMERVELSKELKQEMNLKVIEQPAILHTPLDNQGAHIRVPTPISNMPIGTWMVKEILQLKKLVTKILQLKTQVTQSNSKISQLKTQVTQSNSNISQLKTQVTQSNSNISQLKTQVTPSSSKISQLKTQVTQSSSKISQLKTQVTQSSSKISQLETQVEDLQDVAMANRYLDVIVLLESYILDTIGIRDLMTKKNGFGKVKKTATLSQLAFLWTINDGAARPFWEEKLKSMQEKFVPSSEVTTLHVDNVLQLASYNRNVTSHQITPETGPRLVIGLPVFIREMEEKYGSGSGLWLKTLFDDQLKRKILKLSSPHKQN